MFKHQDLQMFGSNLRNMSIFHPLEAVCRRSETQLEAMSPFSAGIELRRQNMITLACLDVRFSRQILTSKVDSRTERVKHL